MEDWEVVERIKVRLAKLEASQKRLELMLQEMADKIKTLEQLLVQVEEDHAEALSA